jgi:hypothetical protein
VPAPTVLSSQKNNFLFQICPRAPLPPHAVRRVGFSTSEFESCQGAYRIRTAVGFFARSECLQHSGLMHGQRDASSRRESAMRFGPGSA